MGRALQSAFDGRCEIHLNDPVLGPRSCSLNYLALHCQTIFVAVPTPSIPDGNADLQAFYEVMAEIDDSVMLTEAPVPIICIKSAVPPDAIAHVQSISPALRIVVSPEFLREASPIEDMLNMRSLVLGGNEQDCKVVADLFHTHSNISGEMRTSILPDAVSAAFLKYQENAFLAMKVSFMNEMFDIFHQSGSQCSWEQLQGAFHQDHERMGTTHWRVPGPDGYRGWGGRCLPKDVAALQRYASRLGVDTPLIRTAWLRNLQDRNGKSVTNTEVFPMLRRSSKA